MDSPVNALRHDLLNHLAGLTSDRAQLADENVVHGCAFIRLYAALKCIAMVK